MSITTLPAQVQHAARTHPDRTAVVDGETTLTFAALHDAVRATARGYLDYGVRPGDRVAIWAPNSWQWQVAAFAVTYLGATLVPLNTRYKGDEVLHILQRTEATLAVIADGFLDRAQLDELRTAAARETPADAGSSEHQDTGPVPGLPRLRTVVRLGTPGPDAGAGVVSFEDLGAGATEGSADTELDELAAAVAPDALADILFTSGTTGSPKGVLSTHAHTLAAARAWSAVGEVSAEDRYLIISPYFHSYGYKVGLVTGLVTGCAVYPMAAFDPAEALRTIAAERITVLPGAPTIFHSLLESADFPTTDCSSLRFANTGAASVPIALVERMQSELTFDFVSTAFGMTECVVATMCRRGDADQVVATTCGRPVDGLEVRIADPETGAVQPPGSEGEVRFRGPMVMQGYLDDPAATAEAIDPEGWLRTGDVGLLDEAGNLRITDRLKDMYICGGFNVYPAEVEQALARIDGVLESAVVGIPDERMGEVGRAYVVRREGAELTEAELIARARERIANYKAPRDVVFVAALPRNLAGKVLKNELRSQD